MECICLYSTIVQEPGSLAKLTVTIEVDDCVTHHSLLFQVSLVSNQQHREVVSILHSQNLGVEFLDLMVAVGRTEGKN